MEAFEGLKNAFIFFIFIIIVYSQAMDLKINRQHIFQALRQLQIVEKLPKQALQEFCRVFKVNHVGMQFGAIVKAFQNKIVDIICQEGQGFEDYLQLPKFRTMGPQLNQRLSNVFRKVWEEIPAISNKEKTALLKKQLEDLTPFFQTTAEYGSFHLKLLQLYKSSSINPMSSNKQQKKEVKVKPATNQPSFLTNNINLQNNTPNVNQQQANNIFPYFPFPPPAPFPKVQAPDNQTYILDNKQHNQLFQIPRYAMQTPPFQQQLDFYPPIDPKNILPSKKQESRKIFTQNHFTEEEFPSFLQKMKKYQFINCVCEGKVQVQEQMGFKCGSCDYSYHFNCLKSGSSNNQRTLCPMCALSRDTLYCKVVKQPVKYNWFLQEKYSKEAFRVELNLQETTQIYEARKKGLQCQLRFLKMDGKKRDVNLLDGFTSQNGILQKVSKHSEITLPQLCKDKKDPISFQINLKSQQDKDTSSKLFFFGIYLVQLKTTDQLVQELFKSSQCFSFQYYNQFMDGEGKVEVSLNGEAFGTNMINYPVRGSKCQHAAFFDFKGFLQLLVDLKKDKQQEIFCPICNVVCPEFMYDSFAYNCITNFPEYNSKHPQALQIYRNGDFAWVADEYDENDNNAQNMEMQMEQNLEGSEQNELMDDPSQSEQDEAQA